MKDKIHPKYFEANVICGGCGATFTTGSTVEELRVNVCSECHPFYTGKQRFVDSEGRVDRFNKKYAKFQKQKEDPQATKTE
ncbi:50S ribosomal protein L31 [Oligoflexia bacterium]|nr:50S ribosomal protein L31 [Oligoflexia bacterium]